MIKSLYLDNKQQLNSKQGYLLLNMVFIFLVVLTLVVAISSSAITKMIGIIEPVMIVVMGITIGFVVLSIIQPIFKMYETIG